MRLMTIQNFRKAYFEAGSQPTPATLRKWIDDDEIPGGRRIGTKYYVDRDAWESDEDALVASVLAAHS